MLYLYYGPNSYLIQEKLAAIKKKYEAKFSSGLNFWKIDLEDDFSNLKSIIGSQSMFEEKKLILARGIFSISESGWEDLLKITAGVEKSADIVVIFYDFALPSETVKKRLVAFARLGRAEEFKNLERPKLINWILARSESAGLKIKRAEAEYLAGGVGPDLNRLQGEVAKLASYKGGETVSRGDIDALVRFEIVSNNFKMIDSLLRKNPVAAMAGLEEQWTKNEEPIMILGALVWQFRILLKLAGTKFSSPEEASKKLGISPWVAKKSLTALRNFSVPELKNIYRKLADADLAVKTGAEDGRDALSDFIHSFIS